MSNSEDMTSDREHEADLRQRFEEMERHLENLTGLQQQVSVLINDWMQERRSTDRVAADLSELGQRLAEAHSAALQGMGLLADFKREAQPVAEELRAVMAQSKSTGASMSTLVEGLRARFDSDFGRLQSSVGRLEPLVHTIGQAGTRLDEIVATQRRIAQDVEDLHLRVLESTPPAVTASNAELWRVSALLAALGAAVVQTSSWLRAVPLLLLAVPWLTRWFRARREDQ